MKTRILLLATSAIVTFSVSVMADAPRQMGERYPDYPKRHNSGKLHHGERLFAGFRYLALTDEQRRGIRLIRRELRNRHYQLNERLIVQREKIEDLYRARRLSPTAISSAYQHMFRIKRQMVESTIIAYNRMEALLTSEQRRMLRRYRRERGRAEDGRDRRYGNGSEQRDELPMMPR